MIRIDPTAALNQLRDLFESALTERADIEAITNTFNGLDDWLSRGGFLPEQWSQNRKV